MNSRFTEQEEKVLRTLLNMCEEIIRLQDGYMDINYKSFGHHELFELSEKLGVDYD